MQILSVRKDGFDVNEFSTTVLILNADGVTWRPARPYNIAKPALFLFGGYNCSSDLPNDSALDGARAIASIWRDIDTTYEPVCCLWPCLGENKLEEFLFHRAIGHARQSAAIYADFLSQVFPPFIMCGHSLGCGLTGWITQRLIKPAHMTVWMGAAVPQYATGAVDPRKENDDFLAKLKADYRFDFSGGLATNAGKLLNFIGDDPVLKKAFRLSVRENACGSHGSWPGHERIPNVVDVDLSEHLKKHGHYRHYVPLWQRVADESRLI